MRHTKSLSHNIKSLSDMIIIINQENRYYRKPKSLLINRYQQIDKIVIKKYTIVITLNRYYTSGKSLSQKNEIVANRMLKHVTVTHPGGKTTRNCYLPGGISFKIVAGTSRYTA